jgi:flavorubredoxin
MRRIKKSPEERKTGMKTLIVYESEYGNTETLARAMAEALSEHGEARATSVEEISSLDHYDADLLIVGSPTQRHGLPAGVRDMLGGVPEGKLKNIAALAFDTRYRGARWITGSAARKIHRLLRDLGCRLLAPPESFFVAGEQGPLEPGEEDRARAWALRSLGRTQRETLR